MTSRADATPKLDRQPSADEGAGTIWWNSLTTTERQRWMRAAGNTGIAADAWSGFKKSQGQDHQS